ncbi:Imm1 family immunity protein [Allokutzneria albata]|nr:Imm1 family immunity protein [Allokutzneria albata]
MNNSHDFPSGAEVPLDQIRAAVRVFAATGKRPHTVTWQRVDR